MRVGSSIARGALASSPPARARFRRPRDRRLAVCVVASDFGGKTKARRPLSGAWLDERAFACVVCVFRVCVSCVCFVSVFREWLLRLVRRASL